MKYRTGYFENIQGTMQDSFGDERQKSLIHEVPFPIYIQLDFRAEIV
jgi:hypothetical protein